MRDLAPSRPPIPGLAERAVLVDCQAPKGNEHVLKTQTPASRLCISFWFLYNPKKCAPSQRKRNQLGVPNQGTHNEHVSGSRGGQHRPIWALWLHKKWPPSGTNATSPSPGPGRGGAPRHLLLQPGGGRGAVRGVRLVGFPNNILRGGSQKGRRKFI